MAEVTWFKVLTDIFSDDKIKIIQSMPEGDALLVMWFKILAQAGKTNDGGYIYLKQNIPYTAGMLSTLFNKPQQTVELALRTFNEFDMIDMDEKGYIFVTNWEKHQAIEKMDKIKEQTRLRVQRHRQKKQLELQAVTSGVTGNVTVTQGNATDIEVDKELEKDISTTTTNADEPLQDVYMNLSSNFIMPETMKLFFKQTRDMGYNEPFCVELLKEAYESADQGKVSVRFLEAIRDRWIRDGIYSRQQSKEKSVRGDNGAEHTGFVEKGIQHRRPKGSTPTESEYAFLDQQNRTGA